MLSWLAFAGLAKRAGSAILTWLSHRSIAQLGCLALGLLLIVEHFQLADARHDRDSYKSQRDYYKTAIDKADEAIRKADATIAALTKDIKDRNDAENHRIADDAGALRVSGPGKAACHAPPAAASGHEQAPAKPNAPGPALPPDDRAGVPWGWLTDRGQEHDQLRAEVQSWREWYGQLVKNWPNEK